MSASLQHAVSNVIRLPEQNESGGLPRVARLFLRNYEARCSGEKTDPITWETATESVRKRAEARLILCSRVRELASEEGTSMTAALDQLLKNLSNHQEQPRICEAARQLKGRSKQPYPGRSTVLRWLSAWSASEFNNDSLVEQHNGRPPTWYGWEETALKLWLQTGNPSVGDLQFWLEDHLDNPTATKSRIRRFIDALPARLGKNAPERIGRHNWQQNHSRYKIRDISQLPVGWEWEGDGHTIDVYIAHPMTGNPVRFELTVFIDVRSQKVVAWNVWYSESALNTLFTLSKAVQALNHRPGRLHVDPGPGFKNKQVEAWLEKNAIDVCFARPGNARGKGLVEGWFKHFEARCGRLFTTYCGHGRVDDDLQRLEMRIKRGKIALPSLEELIAVIGDYITKYNARPKSGKLQGQSPDQVWAAGFKADPPVLPELAALRLQESRTVSNFMISKVTDKGMPKRHWTHQALGDWNGEQVLMEYDPLTWDRVWVRQLDGQLICEAYEVDRPDAVSRNAIESGERGRTLDRKKRLERKLEEVEAQQFFNRDSEETSNQILDAGDQTLIEQHHNPLDELKTQAVQQKSDSLDDIDFLDTDY